jgi:hypothetical protein
MKPERPSRIPSPLSPENRMLTLVFFFALAIRLYFALVAGTEHNNYFDMMRYNQLALQGGLSYSPPPGYPLFLRLIYSIFGNLNFRAVYIAQSIISAATVLYIFRVAARIGSRRAGFIAAWAAAVYPNFIVFNLITLTETIGLLFVLSIFDVMTRDLGESARSILVSVDLCAAYFVRPSLIFFWPGVLWCVRRRKAFIAVAAVIFVAWMSYGAVSGKGQKRFARGLYKTYNPAQRSSRALELKDTPLGRDDLPGTTYLKSALDFVVHNKWETVDIIYYKLKVLVSRGYSNYTVSKLVKGHRTLDQLLYYCYLPVMLLGFTGMIRMYNKRTRCVAIPMMSYLIFNILLSIFKARYRLMVEPGLIIFASLFIDERIGVIGSWMNEKWPQRA